MATREYQFIVGPETSTLPAVGTPSSSTDLITLGYADNRYVMGREPVADITALKAISNTGDYARQDGEGVEVLATNSFYVFDAGSSATGNDDTIVTPTAGTGRWYKIGQPIMASTDNRLPKYDGTGGNLQTTGIAVDDSNNVTGINNLTIDGDLTINGDNTILNTTVLDVEDVNITVNKNGNDALSEGAGITVDRTGTKGSFKYANALTSKFKIGDLGSEVEIATVSGQQQFTNKDIDGGTASNTNRLTIPKAAKTALDGLTRKQGNVFFDTTSLKPYYDDGTNLKVIGSGSGGISNYITSNDAEAGTTGWVISKNTVSAATPDNGFVTSLTTNTWTVSASSPLAGDNSFLYTLGALGNQAYYPVTINSMDKGKVLTLSFDYAISSGTYADDTVTIWIYDVTNAVFIQGAPFKIKNHSLVSEQMYCEFQTASNSTSYRVLFHQAAASTAVLKIDNIVLARQGKFYGSPITDLVTTWTPTGGLTTNVTYTGKWRRVGDSIELEGTIAFSGANTQGILNVFLPNSLQVDTTKLTSLATARAVLGNARIYDASTDQSYDASVVLDSASGGIRFSRGDTTIGSILDTSLNRPITFAASDTVSFHAMVPVVGWSSSVVMSNDADTRVVAASYQMSSAQTLTSTGIIKYDTKLVDTHSSYNTTTGVFTAPVSGIYKIIYQLVSITATAGWQIDIRKNSTTVSRNNSSPFYAGGTTIVNNQSVTSQTSFTISLNAGETIDIFNATAIGTGTLYASSLNNYLSIERISGPAQIAASEVVSASYVVDGSGQTLTSSAPVQFNTKRHDTHNAITTGSSFKFTAPVAGYYRVTFQVLSINNSSGQPQLGLRKNTTTFYRSQAAPVFLPASSVVTNQVNMFLTVTIQLIAGDYIDVYITTPATVGSIYTSSNDSYICIDKL